MIATMTHAVTHLGSSTLLMPLSALYATLLWRRHSAPLALRWLAAAGLGLGVMAGLKLFGHGCGLPPFPFLPEDRFVSPSGHAAFATIFYGSVGALAARGAGSPGWRGLILLATVGLVAAISVSRVLVSAHSAAEVVAGLLVGGLTVGLFLWSGRTLPAPARPRMPPLLLAAVALGLAGMVRAGDPSIIESGIRTLAAELRTETGLCGVPRLAAFGHGTNGQDIYFQAR
ncbi:membrane-associated phospholipid phosphatase [Azospirillum agricola]|uniref:phosphatase PAP2 family protein n=1 Tax=Azospirillum agricola TaxID=1720247 RepID=UPI001AE242D4|nr:phosphatase PAP2 family protein [Azospirillum agricola]MBP2226953.1 membrane-associated phospholipid phosphatase [Azospirillum agricola]